MVDSFLKLARYYLRCLGTVPWGILKRDLPRVPRGEINRARKSRTVLTTTTVSKNAGHDQEKEAL